MNYKRKETTFVKAEEFDGSRESYERILALGIQGSYDETYKVCFISTHLGSKRVVPEQVVTLNEFNFVTVYNKDSFYLNFEPLTDEQS